MGHAVGTDPQPAPSVPGVSQISRVKDLWSSKVPVLDADGNRKLEEAGQVIMQRKKTSRHPDNGGSRTAKRFQACWINPDGREETKMFAVRAPAEKYAKKMEADADRDEYIARAAAKETFGPYAEKHLAGRRKRDGSPVTEGIRIRNLSIYRNHVEPEFAHRRIQAIKASEIQDWLDKIRHLSPGVQVTAFGIVSGTFALAVADKVRRDNPARRGTRSRRRGISRQGGRRGRRSGRCRCGMRSTSRTASLWTSARAWGCGRRRRSGFSPDELDWEGEKAHVRRQVRRVGQHLVFKLPKGGKQRTVPLPQGTAAAIRTHEAKYPVAAVTLPWMNEDGTLGKPVTVRLLLTWRPKPHPGTRAGARPGVLSAGKTLASGNFNQSVWKPALARAGLIEPARRTRFRTLAHEGGGRHSGMHMLRHVYEGMLGDGGVSLVGQVEFLGHSKESQG